MAKQAVSQDDKGKIQERAQLKHLLDQQRAQGKRIVFTNGCFDLIHRGHIHCLKEAKKQGDVLVVGLNSDSSVRSLKGPPRPILPQEDRAEILAALACVDYVAIFNELDPGNLIELLKPDVLVKGGDYSKDEIVGAKLVQSYGGRVVIIPYLPGASTSALLEKLKIVE